jgi:hypothetical protein
VAGRLLEIFRWGESAHKQKSKVKGKASGGGSGVGKGRMAEMILAVNSTKELLE